MSNLLFDLPEGVQWNVMKFMRHPVAEIFANDKLTQTSIECAEWTQKKNYWDNELQEHHYYVMWFRFVFFW